MAMIIIGVLGALFLGGGMCFLIGLFNGEWDILFVGLLMIGIGAFPIYFLNKKEKKEKLAEEEKKKKKEAKQNYKKMLEQLISTESYKLDSALHIEKAKLIVSTYLGNENADDFKEYCEEAKEKIEWDQRAKEIEEEEKKEALLNKIRKKEKQFYNKTMKYASLYGRDKRKQYYIDSAEIFSQRSSADTKRKELSDQIFKHSNQLAGGTDVDWAIAGGIADAIAGPGAGIATAAEIQLQNAAAEPKRREIEMNAYLASIESEKSAEENQNSAEHYFELAQECGTKLLDDSNPMDLFNRISPTLKSFVVTETGAVKATIETKAAKKKIFDSVDAVIDGTIKAKIQQNNKTIGEIIFVLPRLGSKCKAKIEGICISLNDPNAEYELTLEPNLLWAIEI